MNIYYVTLASFLAAILAFPMPAQAAAIKGKVTYQGRRPKLRPIKMGADPVCLTKPWRTFHDVKRFRLRLARQLLFEIAAQ